MSAVITAFTHLQTLLSTTAPATSDHILIVSWYKHDPSATSFDDNIIRLWSADNQQMVMLTTVAGTLRSKLATLGRRGSSDRGQSAAADMVYDEWRLGAGLLPPGNAGDGPLVNWDNGDETSLSMPIGTVSGNVVNLSIGDGGNFNFYSWWRGKVAESAVFTTASLEDAEGIVAQLGTGITADAVELPAGAALCFYAPLFDDASVVVGPALSNSDNGAGVVTFDDTDHPDIGGGGGPIIVDLLQATETNTAFAMGAKKLRAIGIASTSNTAFAMGRRHLKAIAQALETDSAFAIAKHKAAAVAQASESDTAFAVQPVKLKEIGFGSETDTAFEMAHSGARTIGLAEEEDSAFGLRATKAAAVGLASETDSAFDFGRSKQQSIGLASETDTGLTFTIVAGGQIGIAEEVDSAFSMAAHKAKAIGLSLEGDSAFRITARRNVDIGLSEEADEAFSVAAVRGHSIDQAIETDTANPFDHSKIVRLGIASEIDTALTIRPRRFVFIGIASETDTAQPMTRGELVTTTIEAALVAIMKAADIAGGRIYHVPLPQNPTLPAVTYSRIDDGNVRNLNAGPAGISRTRFQLDIWAAEYSDMKSLETTVAEVLDGYRGTAAGHVVVSVTLENQTDLYEDARRIYRALDEITIAHREGGVG